MAKFDEPFTALPREPAWVPPGAARPVGVTHNGTGHPSTAQAANEPQRPAHAPAQDMERVRWPAGVATVTTNALRLPPAGKVRDLVDWLVCASLHPVPEVALVAALGWVAGIFGRQWQTPGKPIGLNMNIIVVADSGVGKEAMSEGLGALRKEVTKLQPGIKAFVNFDDYASGPALAKSLAAQSTGSFCSVFSEFGHKLRGMTQGKDMALRSLRVVITKMYMKSSAMAEAGNLSYSEKFYELPGGVAFSFVGDTTPGTLFSSMTPEVMEDGFLSRMLIVEYNGPIPPKNESAQAHGMPPAALVQWSAELVTQAATMRANNGYGYVQMTTEAGFLLGQYEEECRNAANALKGQEDQRQLYTRAHLKALKLGSNLACADDHMRPTITRDQAEWAIYLVRRNVAALAVRIKGGDVGEGDDSRERKLLAIVYEYMSGAPQKVCPAIMQRDGVVPRRYLQQRVARVVCFTGHPFGAKRALDDAITTCMDNGYFVEMDKTKAGEAYTYQGRCYRVVQLPNL